LAWRHLRDKFYGLGLGLRIYTDRIINWITTCLENLEMSGNLTTVREMSGILLKIRELSEKNLVREKLPKTVHCNLHICVHTGI